MMTLKQKYDPEKFGAVTAIRIYFNDWDRVPMADIAFAYGGMTTICWVDVNAREEFSSGINGYTYIFDERPLVSGSFVAVDEARLERFKSFIKTPDKEAKKYFEIIH